LYFSTRMVQAIKSRRPEVQAARHAEFERRVAENAEQREWLRTLDEIGEHPGCFFDVAGSVIRRRMGGCGG
jgi:hypothetical protein